MSLLLLFNGNQPLIPYVAGNYYPAGFLGPNAWDGLDFDTGTVLTGIPDVTALVQTAINLCQASAQGGRVVLPPGVVRINGVTISGGGVALVGSGWEEYDGLVGSQSPAKRGKRGTYVLTDSTANSTITITSTANNVKITDLAFIQTHAPEAVSWSPRAFKATINLLGDTTGSSSPSAGSMLAERLLFWGCSSGIRLGKIFSGPNGVAGKAAIKDCAFETYSLGIDAELMTDALTVDNCTFGSQLLSGSPNQQKYVQDNNVGIGVISAPNVIITNSTFTNVKYGSAFYNSGNSSGRLSEVKYIGCGVAVYESSTTCSLKLSGFTVRGQGLLDGTNGPSTAIESYGEGVFIDVTDCNLNTFDGAAVIAAQPVSFRNIRFGPNCTINGYNNNPGLHVSFTVPNPAPAIYAPHTGGPGTRTFVQLVAMMSIFNGAGGAPQFSPADVFGIVADDGFGWTAYTPTPFPSVGAFTTASAAGRWKQSGKLVTLECTVTITTNGSGAQFVMVPIPAGITVASDSVATGRESATGKMVAGALFAGVGNVQLTFYDGTYPGATGATIKFSAAFEAA